MIEREKLESLSVDAQKLHDKLSEVVDDFDKHLSKEALNSPEGKAVVCGYFETCDFFRSALGRIMGLKLNTEIKE
jgi:molecular chaperone GrpE (heat shock protein)